MARNRGPREDVPSGGLPLFLHDLGWSLKACAANPWFVILVAVVLALSAAVDLVIPILAIPYAFLLAGFAGTQWIFYLRIFKCRDLMPNEVLGLTWSFIGRFVRLGLIVIGPAAVVIAASVAATSHRTSSGHISHVHLPAWIALVTVLYGLVIDVVLTFVTPSLVYSTRSAIEALRRGLGLLRTTWPGSAWYVLSPGLTLSLVAFAFPRSVIGVGATVTIAMFGGLLGFGFKGAIASYCLRRERDGIDNNGTSSRHATSSRASKRSR